MDGFFPDLPSQEETETSYKLPPVRPEHAIKLANHLASLYSTNSITDISVKCADETFNLHAPVLSNGSGYFRRVLLGDDQSEISLEFNPDIEISTFRIIVDSLYTGEVEGVTTRNVTAILEASHHMEVAHVTEACTDFMLEYLNLDNCLNFWLSATLCGNELVRVEAIGLIGRHLQEVATSPEYLGLQSNTVTAILSDDRLQVSSEVNVYEAAMSWLKFDEEARASELTNVLKAVRLTLLPVKYLVDVVGKEDMIEENNETVKLYSAALKSQVRKVRIEKNRSNVIFGVRGGWERVVKGVHDCPNSTVSGGGGIFGRTCIPKGDDGADGDVGSPLQRGLGGVSSTFSTSMKSLGETAQTGFAGMSDSMKKFGNVIAEKMKKKPAESQEGEDDEGVVTGEWGEVDTSAVDGEEGQNTEERNEEGMDFQDDEKSSASYQSDQLLEDCREEDENNEEVMKNSAVSLNKPLEALPEGNEEDLVSEENSFNMDNLSLDAASSAPKDEPTTSDLLNVDIVTKEEDVAVA